MPLSCGALFVFGGSLFFFALGLINLFNKDLAWDIQEWQNSMRGVASERTDAWETMSTFGGIVYILGGIFFFVAAIIAF